jgi:RNA polymerase Rpb3/Rpb11 dimerisation domain
MRGGQGTRRWGTSNPTDWAATVVTFRRQLHTDDKVLFAGYQMPHPLVNEMKIKARRYCAVVVSSLAMMYAH